MKQTFRHALLAVLAACAMAAIAAGETGWPVPDAGTASAPVLPPASPASGSGPASPHACPPSPDSDARTAEEAARAWVAAYAGQPGMERWRSAGVRTVPLGPGRHGWLALVIADGQTAGHLIVAAKPDGGFRLAGCGLGEPPEDLP